MNSISYRKVTQQDIQTLVELRIRFAIELAGEQSTDSIEQLKAQLTEYFTKATAEQQCISYIAMYNGEIAGIGSVMIREQPGNFKHLSGKWGYIMNMYTIPEFRRNGICKGLLHELITEASTLGVGAFELHASKEGELVYVQEGFLKRKEPTYRKFIHQ